MGTGKGRDVLDAGRIPGQTGGDVADQMMAGIPASAADVSSIAHNAIDRIEAGGSTNRMQADGAGGDLDHGTGQAPGGGGLGQTEEAKVAAIPRKTLEAHWARITEQLIEEFGQNVFDCWFRRVQLEGQRGASIVLTVPTKFLRSWIRNHYLKRIKALWHDALEAIEDVALDLRGVERVPPHAAQPTTGQVAAKRSVSDARRVSPPAAGPAAAPIPGFESAPLEKRMTFATFLQDQSNQLARAAALEVAGSEPGTLAHFNPLYVHGGVGRGKTHLLHAIAWKAREAGRSRILYLTAEQFMLSFVAAARSNDTISFKTRLREIDLLLIDDLQFLQGKATRREFAQTINALIDACRQVVVVADRPPSGLDGFDERLRSRLAGGLVVEVHKADCGMRRKIIEGRLAAHRTNNRPIDLPEETIEFIARNVASNGREIEGTLNRLIHFEGVQSSPSTPLTVERIEGLIRDLLKARENQSVRIDLIQKVVAREYGITLEDVLSARRTRAIVLPRQIAMFLSKALTPRSLPDIGRRFGDRDHTTVIHGVRKIERLCKEDPTFKLEVERLRSLILEEMRNLED
jgi:chromosomal replication initiator protein